MKKFRIFLLLCVLALTVGMMTVACRKNPDSPTPGAQVRLTLVANDGSEATVKEIEKSQSYTLPTPTRSGYAFSGWYLKEDFSGDAGTEVKLDGEGEDVFKTYSADDVAAIPGGRPKPGEPLPQLLKDRPAPEPAEQKQDDGETRPKFYPVEQAEPEQETKPRKSASEVPVRKRQGQSRGRGKRPEQPKSQTQEKETKPRKEPRQQKAAAAAKDQAKEPQQRRSGQNRRRRPGGRPKPPKSTEE